MTASTGWWMSGYAQRRHLPSDDVSEGELHLSGNSGRFASPIRPPPVQLHTTDKQGSDTCHVSFYNMFGGYRYRLKFEVSETEVFLEYPLAKERQPGNRLA